MFFFCLTSAADISRPQTHACRHRILQRQRDIRKYFVYSVYWILSIRCNESLRAAYIKRIQEPCRDNIQDTDIRRQSHINCGNDTALRSLRLQLVWILHMVVYIMRAPEVRSRWCHSHSWHGEDRVKLAVLSRWVGGAYSVFVVNQSDTSQS